MLKVAYIIEDAFKKTTVEIVNNIGQYIATVDPVSTYGGYIKGIGMSAKHLYVAVDTGPNMFIIVYDINTFAKTALSVFAKPAGYTTVLAKDETVTSSVLFSSDCKDICYLVAKTTDQAESTLFVCQNQTDIDGDGWTQRYSLILSGMYNNGRGLSIGVGGYVGLIGGSQILSTDKAVVYTPTGTVKWSISTNAVYGTSKAYGNLNSYTKILNGAGTHFISNIVSGTTVTSRVCSVSTGAVVYTISSGNQMSTDIGYAWLDDNTVLTINTTTYSVRRFLLSSNGFVAETNYGMDSSDGLGIKDTAMQTNSAYLCVPTKKTTPFSFGIKDRVSASTLATIARTGALNIPCFCIRDYPSKRIMFRRGTTYYSGVGALVGTYASATDAIMNQYGLDMFANTTIPASTFTALGAGDFELVYGTDVLGLTTTSMTLNTVPVDKVVVTSNMAVGGTARMRTISSVAISASTTGAGSITVQTSFDGGATWRSWNGSNWGVGGTNTIAQLNAYGETQWVSAYTAGSLMFKYTLSVTSTADTAAVYGVTVTRVVRSTSRPATYGAEYSILRYVDACVLTFVASGSYKVNYIQ